MVKVYFKSSKSKSRPKGVNARQTKAIKRNSKAIQELRKPQEMKWLDGKVLVAPYLTGTFSVLNAPLPWDTEPSLTLGNVTSNDTRLNSREGNQIVCKRYQFRGLLEANTNDIESITNLTDVVRVRVIYMWINSPHIAGAIPIAPVLDDILETPTDPINSLYKKAGNLNFRVLKDYTKNMQPQLYGTAQTTIAKTFQSTEKHRFNINDVLDLRKMRSTEFQESVLIAGTLPFKGMLVRCVVSDAPGISEAPSFFGQSRLTFEDEV